MHTPFSTYRCALIWLLLISVALPWQDLAAQTNIGIQPVVPTPDFESPLSPNRPAQKQSPFLNENAYNTQRNELDLWQIESKRFIRSQPVFSPNRDKMAYTEVTFMGDRRQIFSRAYVATADSEPAKTDPRAAKAYSDPNRTLQNRALVASVGHDQTKPYVFNTLTIVDWSADGSKLLLKQKNGTLHIGLKTSDIIIYDENQGVSKIYPELKQAVSRYWAENEVLESQGLKPLSQLTWDIIPLGWEVSSNSKLVFKAWAYVAKGKRRFLGAWEYDAEREVTRLISVEDRIIPVAANGLSISPNSGLIEDTLSDEEKEAKKRRRKGRNI